MIGTGEQPSFVPKPEDKPQDPKQEAEDVIKFVRDGFWNSQLDNNEVEIFKTHLAHAQEKRGRQLNPEEFRDKANHAANNGDVVGFLAFSELAGDSFGLQQRLLSLKVVCKNAALKEKERAEMLEGEPGKEEEYELHAGNAEELEATAAECERLWPEV